jgi:large subunit ribosomal protein L13
MTKMTASAKNETVKRDWYIVDATDKVLGRLSTRIATILRGKHKAEFTPHVDTGDHVIVINAEKIRVTGNKKDGINGKKYYDHTSRPGSLRTRSLKEMLDKHPEEVIQRAVKNMLPGGPLANAMFKKMKVYAGSEHPHVAQQPKELKVE